MPSQIKVDEIKNVAGQYKIKTNVFEGQTTAGSITVQGEGSATTNLQQGLAKAWINFDGTAVDGTADLTGVNDSFNLSSLVDNGTGIHTVNISSDMGNTNYNITVTDGQTQYGRLLAIVESDAIATGSCKVLSGNASTGGALDAVYFSVLIHGDLA